MTLRIKQAALTCALALPLVLTAMFAGPLTTSTSAQAAPRMVGPNFPILLDTNGDGQPGAGDTNLNPSLVGNNQLQLPTVFSCGTQANTRTTSDSDNTGKFRNATRTNNGRAQTVDIAGFTAGGASAFSYVETAGGTARIRGNGALTDGNGDGLAETFNVTGGNGSMLATLVFTSNSTHVSIPVSQANMLGARGGRCGPSAVAQIWVPLADTNGDGRGDTIMFDLDGNGIADPQFYSSAPLGAPGVPTTGTWGLMILTLLLGSIGVWYLGQRRLGDAGLA